MDSKIRVAIVGGGIGGTIAAIALLKHPHLEVNLYEAAPGFAEVGAGMGITPNAARSLQEISPDAYEFYQSICTSNFDEKRKKTWVTFRSGTDATRRDIYAAPNQQGLQTFYRPRLLNGLVSFLPDGVAHFNKKFESATEGPSGLTIHFVDGSTIEADCLLGADGVHSTIRRHVLGADWKEYEPRFHGICAYRNVIPMEEAKPVVGEDISMSGFVHMSPDHMAVSYPIDGGKLFNIAVFEMNISEDPGPWHTDADLDHLQNLYSGWTEHTRAIVGLLNRPDTMKWPVRDLPDLPTFINGKVAIMGDAAHAMTPFQGAGAGQAIEDAYLLQAVLGLVEKRSQILLALQVYDEIRRPRVQIVAQSSRECGELQGMRFAGVAENDDAGFAKQLGDRCTLLWEFKVKDATELACGRYRELTGEKVEEQPLSGVLEHRAVSEVV